MAIRDAEMTTAAALETMHNDLMLERRTAMPGQITRLNIGANSSLVSVNVQPLIYQMVAKDNGLESELRALPIINNVPLVYPRAQGAGFALTMPIAVGDEVLLVIADRAIDNWQKKGGLASPVEPVTPRAHDLTDAIAIIGLSNDSNAVPNWSFDKAELRNNAGNVAVQVSNDDVVIKKDGITATIGSANITLNNGTSSIEITPDSITITADTVTINGEDLVLASTLITVTASDLVSAAGVSLTNHIHEVDQPGPLRLTTPPL